MVQGAWRLQTSRNLTTRGLVLSSVLSAVESKLAESPVPVQLRMPDGQKAGASDASVVLTIHNRSVLANLVAGQVGKLGEDYVYGKFDVEGSMRDLMRAAAAILPKSPVRESRDSWFSALIMRLVS